MKTCMTCRETKSLDEFGNYKRYTDGKHRICRVCWNATVNKQRWAHGTQRILPFLERLWGGVQQCGHGDICLYCCWPWLKSRSEDGYGKFSFQNQDGKQVTAVVTRVLYEVCNAVLIPDGHVVAHHCDDPPCCNFTHFFLTTPNGNRQDCVQKGRQAQGSTNGHMTQPDAWPRGEKHHRAKLSASQVVDIRIAYKNGASMKGLGRLFRVSDFTIRCIVLRKSWKHI